MPLFQQVSWNNNSVQGIVALQQMHYVIDVGTCNARITVLQCNRHPTEVCRTKGLVELGVQMHGPYGERYRYSAVLAPQTILSISGVHARPEQLGPLQNAGAQCRTEIDPRGWLEMPMDDHTVFRPQPDQDRFLLQLGERPTGLEAKLITYRSVDRAGISARAATAVGFDIPIEKLLWRKAPRLLPDDIVPEGEDFVHFERIGHVSDPGAPKDLLPCPIRRIE